jgi:hypothetical protein
MESRPLAIVIAGAALVGGLGVVLAARMVSQPGASGGRSAPAASMPSLSTKELAMRHARESAACATLEALAAAQAAVRASAILDSDRDGVGEYAYLGELAAAVPPRGASAVVEPALMPSALGDISANGVATRSGYHFRVFLPGAAASGRVPGLAERAARQPDPENAELYWCAYAWPVRAGETGLRAFFVSQAGAVLELANEDASYGGEERMPAFDAAFPAKRPYDMSSTLPIDPRGSIGSDGRTW